MSTEDTPDASRITGLSTFDTSVLPLAAIYGGNASGKSNFFSAINFARSLIVRGTLPSQLIPVQPYRLDKAYIKRPTSFEFALFINDAIYEFAFSVIGTRIVRERLSQIDAKQEVLLYDRYGKKPHFHDSLKRKKDLRFAFRGTRDNQLFLTNSVSQRIDRFRPVYEWFDKTLTLIAPDNRFQRFEVFFDDTHHLSVATKDLLGHLDTGILQLGGDVIPIDHTTFPTQLREQLLESVNNDTVASVWSNDYSERYFVRREKGELVVTKLVTYHKTADGSKVQFEINDESDGSKRIIDLIPAFHILTAAGSNAVFVVDEIDRSLHSLVIRRLLELYLDARTSSTKSQLLFTTHDVTLMDHSLLRPDEMWVAERGVDGVSTLSSISDYAGVSEDFDFRDNYLKGRFGGIPRMLLGDAWPNPLRASGPGPGK